MPQIGSLPCLPAWTLKTKQQKCENASKTLSMRWNTALETESRQDEFSLESLILAQDERWRRA
jgi:hypothetical protein